MTDKQVRMVPLEPTEAMWRAGSDVWTNHERPYTFDCTKAAFRAMIAAAPSVQPDREAVARVIAADLLRQDYEPAAQPKTVTFSEGLSWSYIDQGWVDFGEIADRVIAYFAALTVQKEEG